MNITRSIYDRIEELNENLNILFRVNRVAKTARFMVADTSSSVVKISVETDATGVEVKTLESSVVFNINGIEKVATDVVEVVNTLYTYVEFTQEELGLLTDIDKDVSEAICSVVVDNKYIKNQTILIFW